MTAQPYQPATDDDASPATDPDIIVVPGEVVEAEDIETGDIDTGDIDTGDIEASTVETADIEASTAETGTIETGDVETGTAETGTIETGDVETGASDDDTDSQSTSRTAADHSQQWHDIQAMFVDDPRESVVRAAAVADAAVTALTESLHQRQAALTPADGEPADTEQLREALRGYRILCQNLADIDRQLRQRAAASR